MPVRTLGNGCHMPPALPHTRSQQPRQSWRTRNRSRQAHDRSTDRRKDARACRRHSEGPTHRRRPSPPETLEVPRYMPPRRRNRASGRARPRSNARPRFRIRIRRAPRNLPPLPLPPASPPPLSPEPHAESASAQSTRIRTAANQERVHVARNQVAALPSRIAEYIADTSLDEASNITIFIVRRNG